MLKYLKYLKYVLSHKKNVFIICCKKKMFIHAFMHDLSKFNPIEFISYAKHFYGSPKEKENSNFGYGWLHHERGNKHHWNYWVHGDGKPERMPDKYVKQMVCDWEAMSIGFGKSSREHYLKNKDKIILHPVTRKYFLNLLKK